MLRRSARARSGFAADEPERRRGEGGLRRLVAPLRLALLPLVALGALVAGGIFLLLLPICGIASIAEGIARWCWQSACDASTHRGRGFWPQH